jgi:prepilin-type N-terminal cleavage/methylation domain-containing protein
MPKFSCKALTLTELLIVLTVLAVLVGLAIPRFERIIETANGREARNSLELLRAAVINYCIERGNPAAGAPICNSTTDCNSIYRTSIASSNWEFVVIPTDPIPDFSVIAQRSGGSTQYDDKIIRLSADGVWDGNWPITY